jgi:hypothetical protein
MSDGDSSKKNDFTNLTDYSAAHPHELATPPDSSEPLFETAPPIETVDEFAPVAPDPNFEISPQENLGDSSFEAGAVPFESLAVGDNLPTEAPENDLLNFTPPEIPPELPQDVPTPLPENFSENLEASVEPSTPDPAIEIVPTPQSIEKRDTPLPPTEWAPPPRAATSSPSLAIRPIASTAAPAVEAAEPFTVLIQGKLPPADQEKLCDLLESKNFGITRKDLEPQLSGDRILIPRISEFAATLIIQALRTAPVLMRMGPSDQIFATLDTQTQPQDPLYATPAPAMREHQKNLQLADDIPVVLGEVVPQQTVTQAIDVLTASAGIRSVSLEVKRSPEYNDLIESLKRELRFQALRKGAHAITSFQVLVQSLDLPSQYRITVLGTAVKTEPKISTS